MNRIKKTYTLSEVTTKRLEQLKQTLGTNASALIDIAIAEYYLKYIKE